MTTDHIPAVATRNSNLLESSRKFSTSLVLRKYCLVLPSSDYAIFFCHVLLVSISFFLFFSICNLVLGLGFGYARKAYVRTLDSRWIVFSLFFPTQQLVYTSVSSCSRIYSIYCSSNRPARLPSNSRLWFRPGHLSLPQYRGSRPIPLYPLLEDSRTTRVLVPSRLVTRASSRHPRYSKGS